MLNRNISNTRKFNRVFVPRTISNTDVTGSLQGIVEPVKTNYSISKKNKISNLGIVNTSNLEIVDITGSINNIEIPSDTTYAANTKSQNYISNVINNKNTSNDFENEIIEFSGMSIKKQITSFDSVNYTFTIANCILEYGTCGSISENFEIYINGLLISPSIYVIEQVLNDVVIKFTQILFSFEEIQNQNVIIMGKFLDIALEEIDDVGLTDETGQYLIL
jgi:hypothetical protein